jgi:AcrR family transcriptional regulator
MPRILTPADEAEFRNRVCDAVVELLAEFGTDGFNMRLLARRLGVSAMTAYRYFRDKDEILGAVRARGFARLADTLEAALYRSGSPEQRLSTLTQRYMVFARTERACYRLMFNFSELQAAEACRPLDEEIRARETFARSWGRTDAARHDKDSELVGLVLWTSLQGIMSLNLAGKISDSHCDNFVSGTIRLLVRASRSGAASGRSGETVAEDWSRTNGCGRREGAMAPVPEIAVVP